MDQWTKRVSGRPTCNTWRCIRSNIGGERRLFETDKSRRLLIKRGVSGAGCGLCPLEEESGRARAAEALAAYGGGGGAAAGNEEEGEAAKEGGAAAAAADAVPASRIFAAEELHGDCSQGARSRALDAFASVGRCTHVFEQP